MISVTSLACWQPIGATRSLSPIQRAQSPLVDVNRPLMWANGAKKKRKKRDGPGCVHTNTLLPLQLRWSAQRFQTDTNRSNLADRCSVWLDSQCERTDVRTATASWFSWDKQPLELSFFTSPKDCLSSPVQICCISNMHLMQFRQTGKNSAWDLMTYTHGDPLKLTSTVRPRVYILYT